MDMAKNVITKAKVCTVWIGRERIGIVSYHLLELICRTKQLVYITVEQRILDGYMGIFQLSLVKLLKLGCVLLVITGPIICIMVLKIKNHVTITQMQRFVTVVNISSMSCLIPQAA